MSGRKRASAPDLRPAVRTPKNRSNDDPIAAAFRFSVVPNQNLSRECNWRVLLMRVRHYGQLQNASRQYESGHLETCPSSERLLSLKHAGRRVVQFLKRDRFQTGFR